jgi:acetolactate synthase-1/2/3 large subunit
MLGSEIIAKQLKTLGIKRVFVYPGGPICPLIRSLEMEGIEYICARNEQGAGYAAIGAAKATGDPQVVMVTSGPGATNLLTPVADAYFDSIPLLVLTGQVGSMDINYQKKLRQTGFQEIDTVNIYKPVTKNAQILTIDEDISETINKSYTQAKEGRPGPVLIDLPMDVQRGVVKTQNVQPKTISDNGTSGEGLNVEKVNETKKLLAKSKKPLILTGNGIYISGSVEKFRELIEKTNVPVVSSLPGVGCIPCDHKLYYGFIGHTGEYFANLAVYNCDLLLVLGARLDIRQTGSEVDFFAPDARVIRVDIDEEELKRGKIQADISIKEDLSRFLDQFLENIEGFQKEEYLTWLSELNQWKNQYNSSQFYEKLKLSSHDIIRKVDGFTENRNVVVTTGVGIHQQMAARYFTFDFPKRRWLTSAGHGAMGFDLPSAIGAMIALPDDFLGIVFVGDGSFLMNIQELATIMEYDISIKIFVLDNSRLGLVSQFQKITWKSDPSTGNKCNPSFAKIAKGFGLDGFDIHTRDEIDPTLVEVFKDRKSTLTHCHIDEAEDILPMLLPKQKMNEMMPFTEG